MVIYFGLKGCIYMKITGCLITGKNYQFCLLRFNSYFHPVRHPGENRLRKPFCCYGYRPLLGRRLVSGFRRGVGIGLAIAAIRSDDWSDS